jgi:glycosyltransferase involved in cell wall biosynthesis
MPKPLVLAFVDYFTPGFQAGGPIRSVEGMIKHLSDEFCFRIITRNHDVQSMTEDAHIASDQWHVRQDCEVLYSSSSRRKFKDFRSIIAGVRPDIIYLNSLFSPCFTLKPLILMRSRLIEAAPTVLAPRGECFPAALSVKKRRKKLFLAAAKFLRLYEAVIWQASTEAEANQIRALFGPSVEVAIVPNLVNLDLPQAGSIPQRRRKRAGELKLVFVGRIVPIKNLAYALECLRDIRGRIDFDIYGLCEDKYYWSNCERRINGLPSEVKVTYKGSVKNAELISLLPTYDLLFLPSLSENFGFAILESLLEGCPALISDRTPWLGLTQKTAGWDLPLERPELFRSVLQSCLAMEEPEFEPLRKGARRFAEQSSSLGYVAQKRMRTVLRKALSKEASDELQN